MRSVGISFLLGLIFLVPQLRAQQWQQRLEARTVVAVDRAAQAEIDRQKLVGLAIGILAEGRIACIRTYGLADREKQLPVTERTVFNWASNSKPLAAVLAMQLVREKALDLDADVRTYVPEFPQKDAPITIRQLLCHQSGIPHYSNGLVLPSEPVTDAQLLDPVFGLSKFGRSPLIFQPGTKTAYSSYAYVLLSAAIQRGAKRPFGELVAERITRPLGMQSLALDMPANGQSDWAVGYTQNLAGEIVAAPEEAHYWKHGAGGFKSDIVDFARWAEGLLNYRVLNQSLAKDAWTPQKTADGAETRFGLGFQIADSKPLRIGHGGSQQETKTQLLIDPKSGRGIVVMCNCAFADAKAVALAVISAQERVETSFDVVIAGGRIVDGTGAPWYRADIGIRDGKIAKIGRIDPAAGERSIDAADLIVAPGFVDMMGQTATPMLRDPSSAINLLTQGITTINAGEGVSAAPVDDSDARRLGWRTMAEYFDQIEQKGLPINVAQTVGHTQIRRLVLGDVDRRPSADELDQMRAHVREAMQAGAIGLSTALIYPPAVYASTEEIAALAAVAGEHGGRYYTHMRNEGDRLEVAIDEALEIGRRGKTPVHIFHLKTAGRQNWGKMPLALAKIKAARQAGEEVTSDIYPYVNNGLGIAAFIHPRHFAEGEPKLIERLSEAVLRAEIRKEMETTSGWENWYRHVGQDWSKVVVGKTSDPRYAKHSGKSVSAIAALAGEDPWDTFFNLISTDAFALPESMTEANKVLAMQQPFVSFCTDVGPAGGSLIASHPRAYGSFPRLLSHYVRDLGAIPLERAIAQASAAGANNILARDRGRIAEGLAADIVVFDFERLADRATFAQPHALSEGVKFVLVNGVIVLDDGKQTAARPGRVLRGPGHRPK